MVICYAIHFHFPFPISHFSSHSKLELSFLCQRIRSIDTNQTHPQFQHSELQLIPSVLFNLRSPTAHRLLCSCCTECVRLFRSLFPSIPHPLSLSLSHSVSLLGCLLLCLIV